MAWVWWLAGPVIATVLVALWCWWRARPARPLNTGEAMQAHRDYLDALTVPARGTFRVDKPGVTGD
jgi:type VI protein secretion system component VasK